MRITIIDLGTYADFKITYTIVKKFLSRGFQVNYITEKSNSLHMPHKNLKVSTYNLKGLLDLSNPADFQQPMEISDFLSPKRAQLALYIKFTITPLINKISKNSDFILVHYPALMLLCGLSKKITQKKNIGVFYVSPAYPNISIPYIMSDEMRKLNTPNNNNYTSSSKYHKIISMLNGNKDYFDIFLKNANIYAMWSKDTLELPKSNLDVKQFGPIFDTEIFSHNKIKIDEEVQKFVNTTGPKVYFSSGSFSPGPMACVIIKALLHKEKIVFYHGKKIDGLDVISASYPGMLFTSECYVDHGYIIPKVSFIVTSGSLGMTTIANLFGKPIIYCPILNEQFFWAKIYSNNTGQGYINLNDDYKNIFTQTKKLIKNIDESEDVRKFTKKIQLTMRDNDYTKNLVDSIEITIKKNLFI